MGFLESVEHDIEFYHWSDKSTMFCSHTHPHYELYFCTEYVKQISVVNGVKYEYRHPCVIISSPYTVHSMSCEDRDANSYDRFVISFQKNILDAISYRLIPHEICGTNSGVLFELTEKQACYLKELLLLIDPVTQQEKETTLALFLNKLLAFCPLENAVKVGKSSFYIQDILQYIVESLSEQTNADVIAQHFAVSRTTLDRDFKRFTGGTLHNFIDDCRLNQAKIFLKMRADMSIGDVAKACGFGSDSYFYSFFKKYMGMTPAEYRKLKNGVK